MSTAFAESANSLDLFLVCNIKGTFKRWQLPGLLSYVTELFKDIVVMEKC